MTKRIVLGTLCIVVSVLLSIAGWVYIKNAGDTLISFAETALGSSDDIFFEQAKRAALEWEKREKIVGVIVKHEDADNVDNLYLALKDYADAKNAEMTSYYLRQCIFEIKVLLTGEKPGWENIF